MTLLTILIIIERLEKHKRMTMLPSKTNDYNRIISGRSNKLFILWRWRDSWLTAHSNPDGIIKKVSVVEGGSIN